MQSVVLYTDNVLYICKVRNKELNDLKITEFMKYVYICVYIYIYIYIYIYRERERERERDRKSLPLVIYFVERGVFWDKNKYRFISPGKGLCW